VSRRAGASLALAGWVAASFLSAGGAAAGNWPVVERQASFFAGQHIANTWGDVFDPSEQLEYGDVGIVGVAVGKSWRREQDSRLSLGFEFQAVGQFGEQDHLEFNLPAVVRYDLPQPLPVLRSLAFLLGLSYATDVPEYEIETRDESQQWMAYWALEAEFGPASARNSFFTRLHHRSGAFGTVADGGGSNVIVLGVRHRW
jgi:hypothetical protein